MSLLSEAKIKEKLEKYLETKKSILYKEFRLPTNRKIDFISFTWKDEYEIEICGYECKGTLTAKAVMNILNSQISEYQEAVPQIYLVADSREDQEENIKTLCSLNGVGYIHATQDSISVETKAPKERQLLLDNEYFRPLRAIGAMFLTFKECFDDILEGRDPKLGIYWCATPEDTKEPQFNCGYNTVTEIVYSAINIEHARSVLERIDLEQFYNDLKSLSDEYWIRTNLTYYPAPRRSVYFPIMRMPISLLTMDDLNYTREKARTEVVWIQVGRNLWDCDEILPRRVHIKRFKQTRSALTPIHQTMSQHD